MKNDIQIKSPFWELTLREGEKAGPVRLVEKTANRVCADRPYHYEVTMGGSEDVDDLPVNRAVNFSANLVVSKLPDKTIATLEGFLNFGDPIPKDAIRLKHTFVLYEDKPCFDETLTLQNVSGTPLPLRQLRFAFAKWMGKSTWDAGFMEQKIYGVPFIAPPAKRHRYEYTLWEVINRHFGLDGWTITDGGSHVTILKHNQDFIEFAELGGAIQWDQEHFGQNVFLFGGAHCWTGPHWGLESERAHSMDTVRRRFVSGEPVEFGLTRFATGKGGWQEGYAAFRREMGSLGHGLPEGYDPGLHIEPFYDFPWEKFSRKQLEPIIEQGAEIGCETLYLDPKWDDEAAETVWDVKRHGPMTEFIDHLEQQHGLRRGLALHVMGSNYYYHDTAKTPQEMIDRAKRIYPGIEAQRVDAEGRECRDYCYACKRWIDEKVNRLTALCETGMTWFMFDFQRWDGPCHSPDHGHPVPSTPEDHAHGLLEVIQRVRKQYPHVQVELHDVLVAGERERRTPMYYLHGLPDSFQECWAFEYMHSPLNDLLCGDALSLYYYNLAYEMPLYAHINMMMDNENCLAFWWMASTVRHLGVGGFGDPKQVLRYKAGLAEYLGLKDYFTKGEFSGPDPYCHIHTLRERNAAVVVVFNIDPQDRDVTYSLDLGACGIDVGALPTHADTNWRVSGNNSVQIACQIPAMSARVIRVGIPEVNQ
jgi:hypothetical protein